MNYRSKEGLWIIGLTVITVPWLWMAWQLLFWVHVIGFIGVIVYSIYKG